MRISTQNWLLRLSVAIVFLITTKVNAQTTGSISVDTNTINTALRCGSDADFFARGAYAGLLPATSFPSYAIFTCGKVDVYYADVYRHLGIGFDDTTLVGTDTLGVLRRNTVCAVLNYIQSVFDFSNVDPANHIRIYVDTSFGHLRFRAPFGTTFYARAYPQYDTTITGIKKGWMNDYITCTLPTSAWYHNDSLPDSLFHASLQMNFDKTYVLGFGGMILDTPYVYWHSDYFTPFTSSYACNQLDLYSVLLHEICHCMGWFSLISFTGTGSIGLTPYPVVTTHHVFSGLDWSFHVGNNTYPLSLTKLLSGTEALPILDSTNPLFHCNNNYWLNDSAAPNNPSVYSGGYGNGLPHSYLAHLDDQELSYSMRQRISPGDQAEYLMGPFSSAGVTHRTYSKGELQSLVDILGFRLTHSFDSTNPYLTRNHTPYSRKMARYPITINNYAYFTETVTPDDTLTNNTGATRIVSLPAMIAAGDITDSDAADISSIYIDSTTLVNFRGCGTGNNHALLSVSADSKHITYTPRPNFYGRAQFGFNITDGKERGSFVVITIDVFSGNNVSCARGANMVCNPGFEEGSEIRTFATADERITNATAFEDELHEGKWQGICFSDSHPYCFCSDIHSASLGPTSGMVAENSDYSCGLVDTFTVCESGVIYLNCPYTVGGGYIDNPAPVDTGKRYQMFGNSGGSYYYLLDSAKQCHRYILDFDLFRTATGSYFELPLKIGFADHTVDLSSAIPDTTLNFLHSDTIPSTPRIWTHFSIPFNYCGNPSNILYFSYSHAAYYSQFHIDNMSLKEDTTPAPPLIVTVNQRALAGCMTELTAVTTNSLCNLSYLWSSSLLSVLTARTDTVRSDSSASYTVIVNDGCRNAVGLATLSDSLPGPIRGPHVVCPGLTITLSDSVSGGTWTSSDTSICSVNVTTGVVTGIHAGTATITYTTFCTNRTTLIVTVIPPPPPITGSLRVCIGAATTLTDTTGGVWSSGSAGIVFIDSVTGVLTGISLGTATVTYTLLTTGCAITRTETVIGPPTYIAGITFVCIGTTGMVRDDVPGGIWSSSNSAIATVGSTTGIVTGISSGTVIITYTNPCGYITTTIIVGPEPAPITGITQMCFDGISDPETTLSDAVPFGQWNSSDTSIAIVYPTGVVVGRAVGTAIISYTVCTTTVTTTVTIYPTPSAITGTTTLCVATTTLLTDVTTGGKWSSGNTAIATVGSTTGVVNGISAGTVTISYTIGICTATIVVRVNPAPAAIMGFPALCTGAAITLSDTTTGGTWSSSNTAVATVGTSTGIVTGISGGTATISYSLSTGCIAIATVTINPLPSSITGILAMCLGHITTLGDATSGGTWSSGNTAIATVGSGTGIVSSVSAGTTTITYKLSGTGCYVTAIVTVYPLPTIYTVTGGGSYCFGGTGVHVGLSWSVAGVLYQLYIGGIASGSPLVGIGAALDFGLETTTGVYTVVATDIATGCTSNMASSATVVENPIPAPITGSSWVCQSSTITLTETSTGGTWHCATGVATVTSGGVVTGVAAGTAIISYYFATGCMATKIVTVYSSTDECSPCNAFGGSSFSFLGTSGIINSSIGAGNYWISNNVTVTGTDTFTDAVIFIAPGDTMFVDTTAFLTLDSCHFYSCGMWQGMILKPGVTHSGRLYVTDNSFIEDALTAVLINKPVHPSSGDVFRSDNAIFNRNNVGVDIEIDSSHTSRYPFTIRNTVFTSRDFKAHNAAYPNSWVPGDTLKSYWYPGDRLSPSFNIDNPAPRWGPYPGVSCKNNAYAAIGIKLNGVGNITPSGTYYGGMPMPSAYSEIQIGDTGITMTNTNQNLYDNMLYGVWAANSNATIENSAFINLIGTIGTITGSGTVVGGNTGIGVYANVTNDFIYHCRLRVYSPFPSVYNNYFYGFATAVQCTNYFEVVGKNTTMVNSGRGTILHPLGGYGYYLTSSVYDTIDISNNTVVNTNTGIALWITRDPYRPVPYPAIPPPVQMAGLCRMDGNLIQAHPLGYSYVTTQSVNMGIAVQNVLSHTLRTLGFGSWVNQLNIDGNNMYDVYNGILVNNNLNKQPPTANGNTIYVRPSSIKRPSLQYGINHTNCYNSNIVNNGVIGWLGAPSAIQDSIRAFYAAANSKPVVGCNGAENIGRGFEFFLNNLNTQWHDNTMTNNDKGFVLNAAVISQQGAIGYPTGNLWNVGGWTLSNPQTFTILSNPSSSTIYAQTGTATLPSPGLNDNNVHNPALIYRVGNGLTVTTYLHTDFIPCPLVDVTTGGGTGTGTSGSSEKMAQQEIPYEYNIIPNNWMGQFELWQTMQLDSTLADSSAVLYVFDSMAQHSRYAYLTNLENQVISGNFDSAFVLLTYDIDTLANTSIDSATQVKLADYTDADNIVRNYQSFYTLYMKYMVDTLTSADSLAIMALAGLCPERNGTVVYQARALYSFLFNDFSPFNDDSCIAIDTTYFASRHSNSPLNGSGGNIQTNSGQKYELFPNPNDGNFILSQMVLDSEPVHAEIMDAVGRTVYNGSLLFAGGFDKLQLVQSVPGLYLLRLKDNRGREFKFKFVIE